MVMVEKKEFDLLRAAFWLVAFVIVLEGLVVLVGVGACAVYFDFIIRDPQIKCDPDGRLFQLLSAALAAALAFFAGAKKITSKDDDDAGQP